MFYVKYGDELKEGDASRLTDEQWVLVMDLVDMLGPFKPLTTSLKVAGEGAIVHVLPQLLYLTTKELARPAKMAYKYSGRSVESLAARFRVDTKNLTAMVSPMQQEV